MCALRLSGCGSMGASICVIWKSPHPGRCTRLLTDRGCPRRYPVTFRVPSLLCNNDKLHLIKKHILSLPYLSNLNYHTLIDRYIDHFIFTWLGAIQKCQHLHEFTNSTLFQTPPIQVYRPTFLASTIWVLCSISFITSDSFG